MATEQGIEMQATLGNLSRIIRAKGGERIRYTIDVQSSDALWDRLKAHAECNVSVVVTPAQQALDLDGKNGGNVRGIHAGSTAASGAHRAQD